MLVASIMQYFQGQLQAWLNNVSDDGAWRETMVHQIRHGGHVYSEEESALIAHGLAELNALSETEGGESDGKGRALKHVTFKVARMTRDKKSRLLIGYMEGAVEASPEDIVAFLMHFDSNFNLSMLNREHDVRYEIMEAKNLCHIVVFHEVRSIAMRNRTFANALLWKKVSDVPLSFVWVAIPISSHPKLTLEYEAHALRANITRCCRLTRMANGKTKIESMCSVDWKGHSPPAHKVSESFIMRMPYLIQTYFVQLKPLSQCDAADGVLLGHLLSDLLETTHGPKRATAIRMFKQQAAALRGCGFAHLDIMLTSIVEESVVFQLGLGLRKFKTVAVPEVVATDPAVITTTAAVLIGHGFESTLRMSATPAAAVDDLVRKYLALGAMAQRHEWFQPMLVTIAKRRMASAPLGLKLRLAIGAVFSIGDMASDINNLIGMFLLGQRMGALILLSMILLNLTFQSLVVIFQSKHRGWPTVLWELSIVFSLLKPGMDAIRVAGGEEHAQGAPVDPLVEMLICRLSELTFESIPGGLVQAIVLLNGGNWTTAAVVSVGLSCLSTAFIATTIDYDLDLEVTRRTSNPEFYGWIPDIASKRVLVFSLLFLYHSAQCIGNTFTMTVLAQTNLLWLVVFILADYCGLLLYKLARNDLIYWVPGFGFGLSIIARFMCKVVTDFTGLIQARHPLELGGVYFFLNALMRVVSWFVAAALYSLYVPTGTTELALVAHSSSTMANSSASINCTGANSTGANYTGATLQAANAI
jgi:hypothetical protein